MGHVFSKLQNNILILDILFNTVKRASDFYSTPFLLYSFVIINSKCFFP